MHMQRDDMEAIPGYLSLHQTAELMTLKWTPNQLMNGNVGELDSEKRLAQKIQPPRGKRGPELSLKTHALLLSACHLSLSVYWDYAMTIRLEEIVYLHCHQQGTILPSQRSACGDFDLPSSISPVNSGGTVVLVSQDGIQRPPLHFPKGGHLLQFLTCLETGLLPHGRLDPPLWNQRGKVSEERKLSLKNNCRNCCAFYPDCVLLVRGKCSPDCGRGAHMAHVIPYQTKKTMKPPIMSFGSCFLAVRWSPVSVFNRLFFPQ